MILDSGTAVYLSGVGGNLLLILACLRFGRSMMGICRAALWINGIIVGLSGLFLLSVLNGMRTSPEAGLALGFALIAPAPFFAEFLVFAAIYRWRMRPGTERKSKE